MQDGAHFTTTQPLEIKDCFCVHPVLKDIFGVSLHSITLIKLILDMMLCRKFGGDTGITGI
jgi:hypothetical protein